MTDTVKDQQWAIVWTEFDAKANAIAVSFVDREGPDDWHIKGDTLQQTKLVSTWSAKALREELGERLKEAGALPRLTPDEQFAQRVAQFRQACVDSGIDSDLADTLTVEFVRTEMARPGVHRLG